MYRIILLGRVEVEVPNMGGGRRQTSQCGSSRQTAVEGALTGSSVADAVME